MDNLVEYLDAAITTRTALVDARHETAFRLFNGFFEGCPDLVLDVYGRTLLIHNYAADPNAGVPLVETAQTTALQHLPWLQTVLVKQRAGRSPEQRQGIITYGTTLDRKIKENGVWYALDLTMNRDASFYLDTQHLRDWLKAHSASKQVLNTFAYTGSLGVAAWAGGAQRVVQLDLNRAFLNVAKTSHTLNGFPITKSDFVAGDFWLAINQMKRANQRFDYVVLDPPFFADTKAGRVDLEQNSSRLINKVRPLINDQGVLIAINNALFVDGASYLASLEALCADGYLTLEQIIPVPEHCTGYVNTIARAPLVDPAPFNHSTKIAVLRVRRKQA